MANPVVIHVSVDPGQKTMYEVCKLGRTLGDALPSKAGLPRFPSKESRRAWIAAKYGMKAIELESEAKRLEHVRNLSPHHAQVKKLKRRINKLTIRSYQLRIIAFDLGYVPDPTPKASDGT